MLSLCKLVTSGAEAHLLIAEVTKMLINASARHNVAHFEENYSVFPPQSLKPHKYTCFFFNYSMGFSH